VTVACGIVAGLAVAVVVVVSAADEPLRRYLERRLNESLDGYTVTIGELDLRLLGFALDLGEVTVVQDARPSPPVVYIPRWRTSVDGRALLFLALAADTTFTHPAIFVTREQTSVEARDDTKMIDRGWQRAVEAVYPLEINTLRVVDGSISYYDVGDVPPMELRHVDFEARDIRNVRSAAGEYPSPMSLTADVLGGRLTASGNADLLAEPVPRLVADVALYDADLVPLAPIARRWDIAVRRGTIETAGRLSFGAEDTTVSLERLVVSEPALEYVRASRADERHVERAVEAAAAAARKPGVRVDLQDVRIRGGTLVLKIGGVTGADGTVYAAAEELPPLELARLDLHVMGISSEPRPREQPTRFELRSTVLGKARVTTTGTTDLLAEPYPTLRADFDLSEAPLAAFAALARRWAFELKGGTLAASGRLDVAREQSALALRRVSVAKPSVTYVERTPTDERRIEHAARAAADAEAKPAFRLDVEDARIRDGTFAFAEESAIPPYRLALTRSDVTVRGFSNQRSKRRGNASLRGRFMQSGSASIDATFANGTSRPELDLRVRLEDVQLVELNDLLRATAGFDVVAGRFSFYSDLAVQDGRVDGYVKPFLKDVDVYDRKQDAGKGLGHQAYEAAVGAAGTLLANRSRDQVATRADISGPIEHPDAATWQIVSGLLRNAFWKALLPGLDRGGTAR
jgi:hypothetical protein